MKTPISYYGGKQNLVSRILPMIPEHSQYGEVFCGGAAVFFAKPKSKHEFINDLDGRVTNFYRVASTSKTFFELQEMIQATAHSEIEYKRAAEILKSNSDSDVQKAWAFWAQTNMSFSKALFNGFAFCNDGRTLNAVLNQKKTFLSEILNRLEKVEIFSRDAVDLIKTKDTPDTFFYIDPPYIDSICNHYEGYTERDFCNLLDVLSKIKGKFLMSSYSSAILNDFYKVTDWKYQEVNQNICAGLEREGKRKTEVLTYNYALRQSSLFEFI